MSTPRFKLSNSIKLTQRRRSDLKSGGTEKFRLAPSALAKFLHIYSYTWAPAEKFPEGRKTTNTFKNRPFFRRAEDTNDNLRVFLTFETKLKVVYCERRRRERKFTGVFKNAEYDVIF